MGTIHIWMKRRGLDASRLRSEWRTPRPAVMNCTAPRPRVSLVPVESWCVKRPSTMYVTISMFAWPCSPNPRFGMTRSSFITRRTPKDAFLWLLYSAKEKWNRDLSQFALLHPRFSPPGFGGFPKRCGGGSLTWSRSAGMWRATCGEGMAAEVKGRGERATRRGGRAATVRGIDAARGMRAAICRARVARERKDAEAKRATCRRLRPAITRSGGSLGRALELDSFGYTRLHTINTPQMS